MTESKTRFRSGRIDNPTVEWPPPPAEGGPRKPSEPA